MSLTLALVVISTPTATITLILDSDSILFLLVTPKSPASSPHTVSRDRAEANNYPLTHPDPLITHLIHITLDQPLTHSPSLTNHIPLTHPLTLTTSTHALFAPIIFITLTPQSHQLCHLLVTHSPTPPHPHLHASSRPLSPSTHYTLALTDERLRPYGGDPVGQGEGGDPATLCKCVITDVH